MTKTFTHQELLRALRDLGLEIGDRVLVHSSLMAIGRVEGGAETVIDALLETVGEEGLIVMPTFETSEPYDARTSATPLGAIPDHFWRRPQAVRSLHPSHSVAAIGSGAAELLRDHEKAPTAYAEGTPYYELAMSGGKVLLLGVDQDRNTTLHAAEAIAKSPYLTTIQGSYVDEKGEVVTIDIPEMAGPHRDFIGLDRLFRESGIMSVGLVGRAVSRLMSGKEMMEIALQALRRDTAAVLCDNPACADCVTQRASIKAARLAKEDFTLAAVAGDISSNADEVLQAIRDEGISALEITIAECLEYGGRLLQEGIKITALRASADDPNAIALTEKYDVPLIMTVSTPEQVKIASEAREKGVNVLMENDGQSSSYFIELYKSDTSVPTLAFNPGRFAAAGEKPFLDIFYWGALRKRTAHYYVADGLFTGIPTLPGRGNGEVKEIISMLRCRSYDGVLTLRTPGKGIDAFHQTASAFMRLLDTM